MSVRFGISRSPRRSWRCIRSVNRSKRYAASWGPAAASGWYCTEKLFSLPASSRSSSPSTTSSLRQTWLTVAVPYGVCGGALQRRVDGEPVVVRGDLDLARRTVHHRLVDAAVAVLELEGAEPERAAEQLVAEADPEVGQVRLQGALEQLDLADRRGRVSRAVGEEQPVRLDGEDVLEGGVGGQDVHLDAALGHHPRGVRLDAEVDRGDGEPLLTDRRDDVGLGRGDLAGELGARHLGGTPHPREQGLGVGGVGGDADAHGAALAQVAGQRTGVDAADADDALLAQLVVEGPGGAPAGGDAGRVADDVPAHPDAARLGSSSLMPVLPTCGLVITTTCRWYDGSVSVSW